MTSHMIAPMVIIMPGQPISFARYTPAPPPTVMPNTLLAHIRLLASARSSASSRSTASASEATSWSAAKVLCTNSAAVTRPS
jgi:hypothetical protein